MTRRAPRLGGLPIALALCLSACGTSGPAGTSAGGGSVSVPPVAPATGSASSSHGTSATSTTSITHPATATRACGEPSATKAKDAALRTLEAGNDSGMPLYNPTYMEAATYDPCADLSAVVVVLAGNGHPPASTLLFHRGKFLKNLGENRSSTVVRRTADDTLTVTYRYARGQESLATPGGRATMTYRYDESAAGKVRATGTMPPEDTTDLEPGLGSVSSDLWPRSAEDPSRGRYPHVGRKVPAGAKKPTAVVSAPVTGGARFYTFMVPQQSPEDGIHCVFSVAATGYQLQSCAVGSLARTGAYLQDGQPRYAVHLERSGRPRFTSMPVDLGPLEPAGVTPQRLAPGEVVVMGRHVCAAATYGLTCWDTSTGHGAFMYDNDVDLF